MSTAVPRWVRTAGAASVALVALVAAVVSYSHVYEVAARASEGWRAWLVPLSVDGLLVGSSLILYVRRRSSWLTWTSLSVGLAVSLVANLAAAAPGFVPHAVAAWPAVALGLSYETLLTLVRQPSLALDHPEGVTGDAESPTPAFPTTPTRPGGDLPEPTVAGEADHQAPALVAALAATAPPTGEDSRHVGTPERPDGELLARARQVIARTPTQDRPVGRRRLARDLGVTEYAARGLLARIDQNTVLHAVGQTDV